MNRNVYSRTEKSSDSWETPFYFFKALQNYMKKYSKNFKFTLDPASSEENHLCDKYYTYHENGLLQDWKGENVFINPPYSDIENWVKKCYYEGQKDNTIVVLLIPVRTDTKYWHKYCMKAERLLFCKGRVNFLIKCDNCKKSVSKTIIYKGRRLCKICYSKITGNNKIIGNGSIFPSVVVIFKNTNIKNPSIRSFEHKQYHIGPNLEQFVNGGVES